MEETWHYLWYPFNDGTGFDALVPSFGGDPNSYQSPAWGELYCVSGGATTSPGGMWGVTNGDELYTIGHATSGEKILGDANKQTIDQSEVVKRLGECGLKKSATNSVIVYACFSGRGDDCLAERIATRLSQLEYSCCNTVYGFTKKVGSKAHRDGSGGRELVANLGDKQSPNWMGINHIKDLIYVRKAPRVYA